MMLTFDNYFRQDDYYNKRCSFNLNFIHAFEITALLNFGCQPGMAFAERDGRTRDPATIPGIRTNRTNQAWGEGGTK